MRADSCFIRNLFRFLCSTVIFILAISTEITGTDLTGSTMLTGKNYKEAVNFLRHNHPQLNKFFPKPRDLQMASAIVFPELIRYNYLSDLIEITALKALYIQYGSGYADFSIGPFQIKPTFAEKIEKEWINCGTNEIKICTYDTIQNPLNRARRVSVLATLPGQMLYLQMFYLLMEERFKNYEFSSIDEKLRIYATAYNFGFDHCMGVLKQQALIRQFHISLFKRPGTQLYRYADIAVYYLNKTD
jgi:hypothetical protein